MKLSCFNIKKILTFPEKKPWTFILKPRKTRKIHPENKSYNFGN